MSGPGLKAMITSKLAIVRIPSFALLAVCLAVTAGACDSMLSTRLPDPVQANLLWLGGHREIERAGDVVAGSVVPVWIATEEPVPESGVPVQVVTSHRLLDVVLRPERRLTDAQLCAVTWSAGGAILVFQETDGSDPSPSTTEALKAELVGLGVGFRVEYRDGVSATLPGDAAAVGDLREHPHLRSIRPLPPPTWPAEYVDPGAASSPIDPSSRVAWALLGTADAGCGRAPAAELTLHPGEVLRVSYTQPDGSTLSESVPVVESRPGPDVDACLAGLDTLVIEDVDAVEVDLPPDPRAWDTNDAALAAKLAEENGVGTVAFKEPESARVLDTGLRAAVSAETIRQGLEMLCRSGVELRGYLRHIGAAGARIPPEKGPALRADSLVDYLEPRMWYRLAGQ